ncbi:DUF4373 domain-containing protein [Sporohalobacter salinus]|uniref:DUF4373 domain-containing protein n=1 Tax=Sporohalobacter salinus TaxID=1494606 RepID=UPI0019600D2A|nr:DUF4373 domain-containing protein [Sporohalobacter salinus]MBM7623738.1 hypothetical protein [Sporohalobacter salinus]
MARPQKEGLDYFPLDVDMDQDDKVFMLEAECGLEGFALAVKLFMKIYSSGYYIKWREREAKIFAHKNSVEVNVVNNVVDVCINEGIFHEELYEKHGILTSHGIQKRFFKATARRKKVEYNPDFMLVDVSEYNNLVNVNKNPDLVEDDDDNKKQSKVKKSKVNNNVRNEDIIDIKSHNMQENEEIQEEEQNQQQEKESGNKSDAEEILNYARQKIITNQLAYENLVIDDLKKHSKLVLKKAIDLAVAQEKNKENFKRGDPKNGVDIGSWRFIQCFIEQAQKEIKGGNQNGRSSGGDQQSNRKSSKDEGARLQEKAFEIMGFKEK